MPNGKIYRLTESQIRLITEGKFKKPIYMLHGTSDIFLREILKKGLEPQTGTENWDQLDVKRAGTRSLATYGGVYLTFKPEIALKYAGLAVRRFGGEKLLVVAQIMPETGIIDEDHIREDEIMDMITKSMGMSLMDYFFPDKAADMYAKLKCTYEKSKEYGENFHEVLGDYYQKFKKTFLRSFFHSPDEIEKSNITQEDINELFNAQIIMSMSLHPEKTIKTWSRECDKEYTIDRPDKNKAEGRYMRAIDHLAKKIAKIHSKYIRKERDKRIGSGVKDKFMDWYNYRIETPITYKGANKIVGIFKWEDYHNPEKIYGEMPSEVLEYRRW